MDAMQETAQEKKKRINKEYYAANKEKWKVHIAKQKEKGYFEKYYKDNRERIITQVKRRYHEKKGHPFANVGLGTNTPTMSVINDQYTASS